MSGIPDNYTCIFPFASIPCKPGDGFFSSSRLDGADFSRGDEAAELSFGERHFREHTRSGGDEDTGPVGDHVTFFVMFNGYFQGIDTKTQRPLFLGH